MNTTMICPKDFIRYNAGGDIVKVHSVLGSRKEKMYTQIRYKKENLDKSEENGNYYSDYKSVITNKNDDVISYAIPRSVEMELFMEENPAADCVVEEFVEGTMVSLFYDKTSDNLYVPELEELIGSDNADNAGWNISTRASVGAKNSFYRSYNGTTTASFAKLFIDCAKQSDLDLSKLNKNLCYNFVIKHTDNKIVNTIRTNSLYIIGVYEIVSNPGNTFTINKVPSTCETTMLSHAKINRPTLFDGDGIFDWDDLHERYNFIDKEECNVFEYNMQNNIILMGYIIKNEKTGRHTKLRNPVYEYMRTLRGNQPKLEHHYLSLRQDKKVQEFIHVFPEYKEVFDGFLQKIVEYTQELNRLYIQLNVTKKAEFKDIGYEYRQHINAIHYKYRTELRGNGESLHTNDFIEYVNALHPSKLMFALNFKKRKYDANSSEPCSTSNPSPSPSPNAKAYPKYKKAVIC